MEEKIRDLAIIGFGPAGMSAALYSTRAMIDTLVFEKGAPGGLVLKTRFVENYLGFGKYSGSDMGMDFFKHSLEYGGDFENVGVKKIIDIEKKIKTIILDDDKKVKVYSILISTGLKPRKLEIPDYDKFFGNGLSTCLVCDGPLFRKKKIAVVGGSNSAIEESTFASEMMDEIYIINRENKPLSEELILNNAMKKKNIKILNNSIVEKIIGENGVEKILIKNVKSGKKQELSVSAIFTYIGFIPQLNFLDINSSKKIISKNGYIDVDYKTMKTKIPGIFAAGDIIEKDYKQLIISASEGAIAALNIKKYLQNIK